MAWLNLVSPFCYFLNQLDLLSQFSSLGKRGVACLAVNPQGNVFYSILGDFCYVTHQASSRVLPEVMGASPWGCCGVNGEKLSMDNAPRKIFNIKEISIVDKEVLGGDQLRCVPFNLMMM